MNIGRQKADFRVRVIDLVNGKSKTFSVHTKKHNIQSLSKKILKCLQE